MILIPKRKLEKIEEYKDLYAHIMENITDVADRVINANDADPALKLDQNGSGSNLLVQGNPAWIEFYEDDQTKPAGQFRWIATGDSLILQTAATTDFATTTDILTLGGSPRTLTSNVNFLATTIRGLDIYPDSTTAGDEINLSAYVGANVRRGIAVQNVASGDIQVILGSSAAAADLVANNSNLDIKTHNAAGYIIQIMAYDGSAYKTVLQAASATSVKLGFFTGGQEQQATIVDADGTLADITTKFNTLLADMEGYGLLKTA